ncbi:transposable element Tcb2 transposase [Trichonephila clavipes]|uniref:Transposable element Tcb2 transposase n=1 Tax=Trichonephila clavipes TaxID=2585209 RepID=A0A8X6VS50_TRICX|nr:transposable element Tcb2 transposase [Trichonephila clavipes]
MRRSGEKVHLLTTLYLNTLSTLHIPFSSQSCLEIYVNLLSPERRPRILGERFRTDSSQTQLSSRRKQLSSAPPATVESSLLPLCRSDTIGRALWFGLKVSYNDQETGCPRQTSRREDHHIVKTARVEPAASSAAIQAQVALSLGTPVSSRTIRKRLAKGHLGLPHPLRVLILTPHPSTPPFGGCHARGNWTAVEWNQFVYIEESRFNLSSDDNRVRLWRPLGERSNPAFALQLHTPPTSVVLV